MKGKKLYLFLFENEANRPDEYWRLNLKDFDKVFTWNPQWVDGKKFFQFWYSMRVPRRSRSTGRRRRSFA